MALGPFAEVLKKMILVFYHIFCNEIASQVVRDQISKIHFSGLYKRCTTILCFLLGPRGDEIADLLAHAGNKFVVQRRAIADPSPQESSERFTLSAISSLVGPTDKFLYIHSKGVTRPDNERVREWREMMEYFLMTRADDCIASLDSCDVVGCNYRHWFTPIVTPVHDDQFPASKWDRGRHFSGNMWWCRGDYWLSLPTDIHDDYFGPEMHVGRNKPRFKVLFESRVDHYKQAVPLSSFVD